MEPGRSDTNDTKRSSDDSRAAVQYLVVPESEQHIAIMNVLETSVNDLTPRDIVTKLQMFGLDLKEHVVEARLDMLRIWGAVSVRNDATKILRYSDLLARNWRYTATPIGRHVQRFYQKVLAGTPIVREIPLMSLNRMVEAAEQLIVEGQGNDVFELIGRLFVSHDDLDASLVGAEDGLAALVDRYDLDDAATAELKTLLVNYATRIAAELERGTSRVYHALSILRGRFETFVSLAISASDARALIERGALTASRGGRLDDWEGLLTWCNPTTGRASRFALRIVRALPGMHINLRRLHTASGTATSRGRLLALARACRDPNHGTAIMLAALGDHPWRKLHGAADDAEQPGTRPWREGPRVEVPDLLRLTGRSGARGRAPSARDDAPARAAVAARRAARAQEEEIAIHEVLATPATQAMSERAARSALAALMVAVRKPASAGRRSGERNGLACTLFHVAGRFGRLIAPTWQVVTPTRIAVFHRPGEFPAAPPGVSLDPDPGVVTIHVEDR